MKPFILTLSLLAICAFATSAQAQNQNPRETAALDWPAWMKIGVVVRLPEHELSRAQSSTNAILIQNFNPHGRTGQGIVGHLDAAGNFTAFESKTEFEKIELGALAAVQFRASGLKISVAENLQTLATARTDRKNPLAIGAARVYSSEPNYVLAPPSDLSLPAARPDAGPVGQIVVAGRFFKLATPFEVGGIPFNVLHFSDFETYDRGRVTFGNLGPNGEFLPSAIRQETFRRYGNRTYIGGIETPIFQIWDRETEIFQQLIGGRQDQKVVQSSQISVLAIAKRSDRYTIETATGFESPTDIIGTLSRPNSEPAPSARRFRVAQAYPSTRLTETYSSRPWEPAFQTSGPSSRGNPHMINIWMCENLFEATL